VLHGLGDPGGGGGELDGSGAVAFHIPPVGLGGNPELVQIPATKPVQIRVEGLKLKVSAPVFGV
jgi:hypothetical protein